MYKFCAESWNIDMYLVHGLTVLLSIFVHNYFQLDVDILLFEFVHLL